MNGTDLQFLKAALHIPPMFYVLQKRPSIYFSFSTILITMMINIICIGIFAVTNTEASTGVSDLMITWGN